MATLLGELALAGAELGAQEGLQIGAQTGAEEIAKAHNDSLISYDPLTQALADYVAAPIANWYTSHAFHYGNPSNPNNVPQLSLAALRAQQAQKQDSYNAMTAAENAREAAQKTAMITRGYTQVPTQSVIIPKVSVTAPVQNLIQDPLSLIHI